MIVLDPWQKDYIEYEDDKVLVAGRQTGKTEALAYDNAHFAQHHAGTTSLIISKTVRQAEEVILKILDYLHEFCPARIGKGKLKPLKHSVWVTHPGLKPSRVIALPIGHAGEGIRGYTIHKLSPDEAQAIPDDVFTAITPMLLTTGGKLGMTGTPKGKKGFFWKAYENKLGQFKVFHINSEEVIENRPISPAWPEWRREAAKEHLRREKERMSVKEYQQEYMGEFIEDLDSVFEDDLIKACCIAKRSEILIPGTYYGGSDLAGMGKDLNTFEIFRADDQERIIQVESITTKRKYPHETADFIQELHKKYKFRSYGIDDGGLGIGVLGLLLKPGSPLASKVKAMGNARLATNKEGNEKRRLLKEDMYFNLLTYMRAGKVRLLEDEDLINSLRSCQFEVDDKTGKYRVFGSDTHIVEGIIRAVYLASKDKHLNIWCGYNGHGI